MICSIFWRAVIEQVSGTISDKFQAAQIALFARPANILSLLFSCTNRSPSLCSVQFRGPVATISRVWFQHSRNRGLNEYLFSFDDRPMLKDIWHVEETFLSLESPLRNEVHDAVVTELLHAKVEGFYQAWKTMSEDKSHHITSDVIQILATACVVATVFVEYLPPPHGDRVRELRKITKRLWQDICEHISSREDVTVHACLEVLSPMVAAVPCFRDPADVLSMALSELVTPLMGTLQDRRAAQTGISLSDPDGMDLDGPISARNERLVETSIIRMNREKMEVHSDSNTLQRSLTIQLAIFLLGPATNNENEKTAETSLVEYLKTLDEVDILSAQNFLPRVFSAAGELTRTDILDIIEHFGETCLQSYGLERCENAQCFCIYMMRCFVHFWTTDADDDLNDSASDLYSWFIQVLLEKKKASPRVSIALCQLLERVLESNPTWCMSQNGPSPRTSLFHILRYGDMTVKFSAANLISSIFGRFLLKDHEAILDDVLESLPTDPDWNEGIALRLYVLAQLASRWNTLLRRSIYHIFETPGQVPASTRYAKKCLRDVSLVLGLGKPKEIFHLFMPQILYTWTENQSITSMPFTIFGYSSLQEMLRDAQDELVGQIVMRANDQDAANLSTHLGKPFPQLLSESFQKAEAYTIARDISIPPSQDSQPKGVESRIKVQLGTGEFVRLIEMRFPETLAILFKTIGQEEQIERAFSKHPRYGSAAATLRCITQKSASSIVLPVNQQPSFRARYLLDEIDFLCKRAGYDSESMWTPALVAFVCRTLLESIHPALGSLHACSVLRKVRILVCIAGPVILQDYPLELILHALRPFLTDFHCSEDALGLFWYLLEAGKPYLVEHPEFLAGIAVSTVVSLRGFLTSAPESTTQESQFRSVLSKSQEFRHWFGEYLQGCRPSGLDKNAEQSFRRLVSSSQKSSSTGTSEKGTYESELLLEIIRDKSSGHGLLNASMSDLILSLLCADFQMPSDLQNDILGDDAEAQRHSVAVWQTIENGVSKKGYQLWAARVLGRAYAATGQINDELLREQNPRLVKSDSQTEPSDPFLSSKFSILRSLCGVLCTSNRSELGVVERTLQLIVSRMASYPELEQCEHAIPASLMRVLVWSPYHCPRISLSSQEISSDVSWPGGNPKVHASQWARDLALSLAVSAEEDPAIEPLRNIICADSELAASLLPYVLHEVLLSEIQGDEASRQKVSDIFGELLRDVDEETVPHGQIAINAILYLRQQPRPHESTIEDRENWLDIDYSQAASAASRCRMHKTALLFIEIQCSRTTGTTRRSSIVKYMPPPSLLHGIFRKIGDPDLFYGVQQDATLSSVMEKLDYEGAGFKNLIFQSAQYDSDLKLNGNGSTYGIIKALNATNLQGVATAMISAPSTSESRATPSDYLLSTSMSLQQWDISVPPSNSSPSGTLFKVLQNLNVSEDKSTLLEINNTCFMEVLGHLADGQRSAATLRDAMRVLGLLSEVDSVVRSTSPEQLEELWEGITSRKAWLQTER